MKTKESDKKLSLKKTTIAQLSEKDLHNIHGGCINGSSGSMLCGIYADCPSIPTVYE